MPEKRRIRLAAVPHVGRTLTWFWLLYSLFNASYQVAMLRSAGEPVAYVRVTLTTFTHSLVWAGVSWLLLMACDFAFSLRRPLLRRLTFVAAMLGAWLLRLVALGVTLALFRWQFDARSFVHTLQQGAFPVALFTIVLAALARGLYWWQAELETARLRAESEERLVRTELRVLADQLEPHFLLNTLTAISALATTDAPAAREMLAGLRELLAYSIRHGAAETVTLGEEVGFIRQYLRLQSLRFGPRFRTDIDVPADLESCLVPRLLLQPLVENAVKYGRGTLSLDAERGPRTLTMHVRNGNADGPPAAGFGIGMACVRARLELQFGRDHDVTMTSDDDTTVVTVRLPLVRRKGVAAA